ncbi:MAG: hypothetical protein JJU36_12595 [Phycisphaeraceae bacterium]|nr:hypothetical protein [Phycisphaeraceae bacterium]
MIKTTNSTSAQNTAMREDDLPATNDLGGLLLSCIRRDGADRMGARILELARKAAQATRLKHGCESGRDGLEAAGSHSRPTGTDARDGSGNGKAA